MFFSSFSRDVAGCKEPISSRKDILSRRGSATVSRIFFRPSLKGRCVIFLFSLSSSMAATKWSWRRSGSVMALFIMSMRRRKVITSVGLASRRSALGSSALGWLWASARWLVSSVLSFLKISSSFFLASHDASVRSLLLSFLIFVSDCISRATCG